MNYDEHKNDVVLEPMEQLLRELSPHLRRAIEMNRKFAELEVRSQSMEGLLDRTPFPVLLVTGDATVRHLNEPAARAIEGRRGVLIAPPGRLAFARPDETAKLRRMIQE